MSPRPKPRPRKPRPGVGGGEDGAAPGLAPPAADSILPPGAETDPPAPNPPAPSPQVPDAQAPDPQVPDAQVPGAQSWPPEPDLGAPHPAQTGPLSWMGPWWHRAIGAWLAAELLRLARLRRSPLARRFLLGKLSSILVIAGGMIALTPVRGTLELQFQRDLQAEARLVAALLAPSPLDRASPAEGRGDGIWEDDRIGPVAARHLLAQLPLSEGRLAFLYDAQGRWLADTLDEPAPTALATTPKVAAAEVAAAPSRAARGAATGHRASTDSQPPRTMRDNLRAQAQDLAARSFDLAAGGIAFDDLTDDTEAGAYLAVTLPFTGPEGAGGRLILAASRETVESLIWAERARLAQIYLVAMALSLTISARLVWTITAPLSDLSSAIELGGDRHARTMSPERIRIPDLSHRRDEMGRLSEAMRGMVAALYDRIESNEQFAADVAHEIKNPLASLRAAAATLPMARDEAQRGQLLAVISQDVRRLDRLVSDISNASRLDRELVHETEEDFNLVDLLRELSAFLGTQAEEKGIDFLVDLPPDPLPLSGLEARLAQVFVNILSNAMSFCQEGDAVRLWARRHENRVLVVIEDTGPGIPEAALTKIFTRFYSERPEGQFGSHSGLGLAISKQIVEAHGGVIWAENIRAADADPGSDPLGARFVVGLPV